MSKSENGEPVTECVNIRSSKVFVCKTFPADSVLRAALLEEKETLEKREFLAKMRVWLSLLRLSFKGQATVAVSSWVRSRSDNSIPFPDGCESLET
jgi:hypothetical protein